MLEKNYKIKVIFIVCITFIISSCASSGRPGGGAGASYTPVIDGPKNDKYYIDLAQCRDLASEVESQATSEAIAGAVAGAIVGGLLGAASGVQGNDRNKKLATTTGVYGGLEGAASKFKDAKTVITNCMIGRGHNVLL